MPAVAVAHTAEKHLSFERVLSLVRDALAHLGGIEAFIKPGQTVLIKPSQAVWCTSQAASTADPLVVGALIRLARNAGAARIQVADSSEGFFDSIGCMRLTGMAEMAAREGAEMVDLGGDNTPNREIDLPVGRVLKRVPLPVPLLEADFVIAVPKAKNSYIDTISGAMELWMGVVNQNWRALHNVDIDMIGRFADIMTAVRPDLCITDALVCGEGDGPLANLAHWCGCILASTDPVAMDVAIAELMGHDWEKLRFAAAGEERGLGDRKQIVYLGASLRRVAFRAWPGHEGYRYLPVNFLVGEGVRLHGTIGHVKSALDTLLRRGALDWVIRTRGTPTIMVGDVEDPEFERHIGEGPYLVFDDVARPEYKNDPRVFFVPGHPVMNTALPQLMRGLGVTFAPDDIAWQQLDRQSPGYAARRKIASAARPAGLAALAVSAALGIRALSRRG